ncbi:MAG: hypothetical protein F4139_01900 [Gemmatimonadetes bacterium]|nr:hypothetical protein [Gemmatimonadota bacterium]MYH51683.1 hypothetical protein [Gemmatimonadota bacterium]MYK67183.1 hypothetical protein [Gemmatimonadota bacterium]
MKKESLSRPLATIAVSLATIASTPARAAAQLVADAGFREACEVLRLGDGLDVPEWLAFSRTPALRLDPAGRLYLNADSSPAVTVLDSDGGFVRYIGGEGEGPGEFAHVGGFGFVGDSVWLQHLFELHIAFFDSAGEHIRTEMDRGLPSSAPSLWRTSIPLAGGYGFYIPPITDADPASGPSRSSDTGDGRSGSGPRLSITRAPEFKRVKLPMLVGLRSEEARDTLAFKYNYTAMITPMSTHGHEPFVTPPLYRIHPNGEGVVTADWEPDHPDEVILRHYDLTGGLAGEVTIGSRLRGVSPAARDAFIDEGVEMAERTVEVARRFGGEVPANLRGAVTEGLLLYDYFEPISTFFLTHDERVWLRDAAPSEGYEAVWVVLGPDGNPEFRVSAPSGITYKAALGDRLWATGRTELDVPYIVLYELRSPGACG